MDSHIEDYSNESQDCSSPHAAVEYLIETENTEQDIEEEDAYCEREDEEQFQEITDEEKLSKVVVTKQDPSFYEYKLSSVKDTSQQDVSYQETFSSDIPQVSAELDSWLQGIKETIMVRILQNPFD